MYLQKIVSLLDKLTPEELIELKSLIDQQVKDKHIEDLGKRKDKRVKVTTTATCIVEREKEFFVKEHKIIIVEMSLQGIVFRISTAIYKNDLLCISFRSPSSGVAKYIDCQALRIKELTVKDKFIFEVAAKSVDKKTVKAYKDMLNKRG